MSTSKLPRAALIALLLSAIALFFYFDLYEYFSLAALKAQRDALAAYVESRPVLSISLFFGAYVLMAALSLPGATIMTLAAGAIFGLFTGTILVSFASSIGATLAFIAARFLFRDGVQKRFRNRLKRINDGVEKDGAFYLLSLRLVPVFPFFVINLVAALTLLRTHTFYWVSQLGMLPATLVYVNAGTQLAKVKSVGEILSPSLIFAFVLLALLPIVARWLIGWLKGHKVRTRFCRPKHFDYNLLVVGGGSAGLVTAYIAAAVKAKVALVERDKMGGECLNTGCVPSKTLLRSARLLAEARDSRELGIASMQPTFEFADLMARVRAVIAAIAPHDSPERYERLGVHCIAGEARLVSPWEVDVNEQRYSARAVVIATGSQPVVPPITGLEKLDYLTTDNLWSIEVQPKRLVILGGGPIGCELAQAFSRIGSKVTIVETGAQLLGREDSDAAVLVAESLGKRDGVVIATSTKAISCESRGASGTLVCEHDGQEVRFDFDRLLLALGRRANLDSAGLRELGVELTDKGTVATDPLLRTNYPSISVCGDVAGPYQFTHVAAHQAWYAAVNSLLRPFWSFKVNYTVIPWCTFTDPEVARVGLSETEAREQEIEFEVTRYDLGELDRALTDGTAKGFVKVLTVPGKDRILGASIVGAHAGEMIAEFVLAMKHNLGLNKLLGTIHIYPTMMEANKYAAGVWKRAHAPEKLLQWLARYFRFVRKGRQREALRRQVG
ncbi:MAG TPA: FAD-dependent oxidoreductase [Woeseiaceae bacterium]|nr:FAD-dependent oxidoreductase [Woeseiaceae bacterium]